MVGRGEDGLEAGGRLGVFVLTPERDAAMETSRTGVGAEADRAVQVVQSQLKDIGVQMEIQDFEFGTLLQKAQAGEHQMEMMGYTYPNPDIA